MEVKFIPRKDYENHASYRKTPDTRKYNCKLYPKVRRHDYYILIVKALCKWIIKILEVSREREVALRYGYGSLGRFGEFPSIHIQYKYF